MPLPLVPGLQQSSLEFVPTASGTLPGLVCPMDGLFPIRLYLGDSSGQPTSTPNGVNWQCEVDPTHNGFIPAQAQTLGTFVQAPPALIQQAEKIPFIFPVQPAPPPIVTPPITSPTPATAAAQKVAQDLAKTSSLTNLVTTALEVTNIANLTLSLAIMNQQETQQIRESVRNRLNKQDDGDILIIAQPASQVVNASFMGQPTTLPPTVGHVPGFATNPIAQGLARALGQFPGIAESQGQGGGVPTGFISIATWAGINFYTETSDPDGMVASWVQAVARDAIRAGHLEDTSGNFYRNDAIIAFGSNNNLYVTHDQFEACLFADTGPKDGPPRTTSQVQIIPAEGTFDFQYFQRLKGAALGLRNVAILNTNYLAFTYKSPNNRTFYIPPAFQGRVPAYTQGLLDSGAIRSLLGVRAPLGSLELAKIGGADGRQPLNYYGIDPATGKPRPFGGLQFGAIYAPDGVTDPSYTFSHWLQVVGTTYYTHLVLLLASLGHGERAYLITQTPDAQGFYWMLDNAGDTRSPFYDTPKDDGSVGNARPNWFADRPNTTLIPDYYVFGLFLGWWIDDKYQPIKRAFHAPGASPIGISTQGLAYSYRAEKSLANVPWGGVVYFFQSVNGGDPPIFDLWSDR